jgi:hypothetical protein
MRRTLPILALLLPLALVAAGCGGKSANDRFASQEIAACAVVQKKVAAVPKPKAQAKSKKRNAPVDKAVQQYAVKIDRALLSGLADLRSVTPPPTQAAVQKRWLAAVQKALRARLRLDTAPAKQIQVASRNELKARRAANDLAGELGIANGCTLTY